MISRFLKILRRLQILPSNFQLLNLSFSCLLSPLQGYCYAAGMAQLEDGNFYAAAPVAEEAGDVNALAGGQQVEKASDESASKTDWEHFQKRMIVLLAATVHVRPGGGFIYKDDHEEMIMQDAARLQLGSGLVCPTLGSVARSLRT